MTQTVEHPTAKAPTAGARTVVDSQDDYYGFERPELVRLVPATARRVLDVGCAGGALGAAVKRAIPGVEVTGIEYVAEVVEVAATRLDHAHQIDLNTEFDLPYAPGYFDAIICGDVLEHLLDPTESLRRLLPYLAPDGVVVASIPNVKHWSVVLPLLVQDAWEYTDEGLLDRTHVHLFTLRESVRMLEAVGLDELVSTDANWIHMKNPKDLEPLVAAASLYGAKAEDTRQLLNAYQYLLVARRPA